MNSEPNLPPEKELPDNRFANRGGVSPFIIFLILILLVMAGGLMFAILEVNRQNADHNLAPLVSANQRMETSIAQLMQPTPTFLPDPVTIVHDVRSLARLETIQYTLEKVVTAQSNQGELAFLFGEKLIFVAHGKVIAGIDMAKLRPEDVRVSGGVLYVNLPPAEVFVATLDNEKSYIYNRDTGILKRADPNLETQARQVAERELLKSAQEDGILDQAQRNGESYLSRLFLSMGFKDVIFNDAATPTAPKATPSVTPMPSATP